MTATINVTELICSFFNDKDLNNIDHLTGHSQYKKNVTNANSDNSAKNNTELTSKPGSYY